jgi:hypothetical protein
MQIWNSGETVESNKVDVIIATPGHSMDAAYVRSLVETIHVLEQKGITWRFSNRYSPRVASAREATTMDSDYLDAFNRAPLRGEVEYGKIFWIDSDISWTPSDFLALYESDKNIVSGVYLSDRGVHMFAALDKNSDPKKLLNTFDPVEVGAVGFGFVCVKQGVFEDMPRPWFVEKFEKVVDEQTGKDMFVPYGEDFSWCISARECGFSIYIDPTVNVSHHKKVVIKP